MRKAPIRILRTNKAYLFKNEYDILHDGTVIGTLSKEYIGIFRKLLKGKRPPVRVVQFLHATYGGH